MNVQADDHSEDPDLNTTINTTPLVDVMLVLLIIFLVTIPVIVKTVQVQLPNFRNIATITKPENIVVAIDKEENIYYNNAPIDQSELKQRLEDALIRPILRPAASRGAYPCRQGSSLPGGRPRGVRLSARRHPESRLPDRTAQRPTAIVGTS
jgi:hypothetical protein